MFICIHGNKTLLGYFHWDSGNTFYLGSSYIHIYMQFATYIELFRASLVAQLVKNLPAMRETLVWFLGWEDQWRRDRLPTPVFWPREFHGLVQSMGSQRSQAGLVTFTFTWVMSQASTVVLCFPVFYLELYLKKSWLLQKIRTSCELRWVTSETCFVYTYDLYIPTKLVSCLENTKRSLSSSSRCGLVSSEIIYLSWKYLQRKRFYGFLW